MASFTKGGKQYGLIIPKKQQVAAPKISNVFGDDNGSDEDDGTDWVKKALKAESEKNKIKKQTKLNMQKALKEDPTIYQYDEVYDDMERTKEQKTTKEVEKRPKYIQNLLKAAERRKKEQEHRIERMVQKEREAEGTMYADKECFVTSAYRAKLEEFKKMEEEDARISKLEAIADVTKQQDISGFYRHLYEQTVENPKQNESVNIPIPQDSNSNSEECSTPDNNSTAGTVNKQNKEHSIISKAKKSRQYRQRIVEDDDSDTETKHTCEAEEKEKNEPPIKNKSVDRDDTEEPDNKKQKKEIEPNQTAEEADNKAPTSSEMFTEKPNQSISEVNDSVRKTDKEAEEKQARNERIALEKKEKARIWEKRTVGPVFEAALQRYYARKVLRISGS